MGKDLRLSFFCKEQLKEKKTTIFHSLLNTLSVYRRQAQTDTTDLSIIRERIYRAKKNWKTRIETKKDRTPISYKQPVRYII